MQPFCIVCGKDRPKNTKSKYCSSTCRKKKWKLANRETYLKKAAEYRERVRFTRIDPIPTKLVCLFCGKSFFQNKYHPEQVCCTVYCSQRLYRSTHVQEVREWGKKKRQKNKERYILVNAKYKDELRFSGNRLRALNRDEFTCQSCFKAEPGVNLVVHHIDFSGQTEKPNNKIENLQTLCRACHIRLHTHVVTRR